MPLERRADEIYCGRGCDCRKRDSDLLINEVMHTVDQKIVISK